ncbi:putative oxidoreductase YtbE isoform X6 [Ascaphus truei]|uniref:putative oxidoreductase YtbE isoform X6 n=1 Tax=Ascaphus truei TaxID=8439 RepID=UPI003F5A4465
MEAIPTMHCSTLCETAASATSTQPRGTPTRRWWGKRWRRAGCGERSCGSPRSCGLETTDLYLMHWPDALVPGQSPREVRAETWRALENLYEKGVCRSIGVSNFLIHHLEQLKEDCSVVPHLNQMEYHPFQRPQELVDYCKRSNIVFGGYCPLAKGQALSHPDILRLANRYGRTPAQICIRWSIQNGIVTIPKSTKEERIRENCEVFDFHLEDDDMNFLASLHSNRKLIHLTYPLWKG